MLNAVPAKTPTSFSREENDTDLYWRIIIDRTCVGKTGGIRASCAMAASRRIQLTALSSNAHFPLPTIPPVSETNDQPVKLGLLAPTPESESTSPPAEKRLELTLFEPDEERCPEFNYPDLICLKQTPEKKLKTAGEVLEDRERNELEALARKFEGKYGGSCKKKKDRVQDLVDIGFGYDESDSFIDNSEAYDELVPASLTTKYGGFYINSGTLQFRPASEGVQKNETSDFDDNFKPKKRKIKQGKDQKMGKKKKDDMLEQNEDEVVKKSTQQDEPPEKTKKKSKKPLSIDKMLKKFHKEKLQQLQMFNARERDQALNHSCAIMQAEGQEPPISADPLLTLIGSASADDLLQAVKAAELDFDLDGLLGEPQNICSPSQEENGEVITKPPASLPEGLPPMLEQLIQELTQAVKKVEGQNKIDVLSSELSNVLLEVEVSSKQLSGKVRSRIFSYLASQLSCSKGTLVKRAKKLHNLQQDGRLKELLQKLENAVARSMPEQIIRFQSHCQAHSEARAAKLEADKKEQRVADGSDEEEEERSGKRVFGPRKRFRWNEEIRELLCEIVNLKMTIYDLESPSCSSLEEYLKVFLEAEVKPLWPKGWMQSRILLIETRKAHGHITGVVKGDIEAVMKARKKPMGTSKLKKASADPEDNKNILDIQGPPALKRKRLSVPVSMQPEVGATLSTTAKTPSNTQTSTTFSIHPANHMEGVVRPSLGQLENHHPGTQRSQMSVECEVQGTAVATEKGLGQMMWNRTGLESDLKRLGEKATSKLTLVAPPDGAQGHSPSVVQGVARLLTTTSMGDAPVSMTAAAGEISCGNPALPTPSMSLLPSTYPITAQPGILPSFAPLPALPFPGLSPGTKLPGQPLGCKGPAPGNFQHGLTHGNSMLCSSTLHLVSLPVSSPAPLHSITPWLFGLDGNQIHADGLTARRKLH